MPENDPDFLSDKRISLSYERTRLAAERTFLAWIRTGLTSVGIGLAVAKLQLFHTAAHQQVAQFIGRLMIGWSIVIFIFALVTYRQSYKRLNIQSVYRSSLIGLTLLTLLLIVFSIVLFWMTAA